MGLTQGAHGRDSAKRLRPRLLIAIWLIGLVFFLLVVRLYNLQILRGEELATKGRRNYVQRVEVPHDRGIIYDRFGTILVDNRASLDVEVTPQFLGDEEVRRETLRRLARYLDATQSEEEGMVELVGRQHGLDRFVPLRVGKDLSPEQIEAIESDKGIFLLDGVNIVQGRRRVYRNDSLAAHVLGYVNEIGPGALKRAKRRGNPLRYQRGDLIGRSGIEHSFEKELRGADGHQNVVVDAKGRRMQSSYVNTLLGAVSRKPPLPGHNVFLTFDMALQRVAEEAFDGAVGAVVALDPRTGAVLALVSVPSFNPNLISAAGKEEKDRLDANPLKPWINRAIQGQYAPGSTFKVITAMAALGAGVVTPADKVNCPGSFRMGRHVWRCHRESGHGFVNLRDALKVSCDTYFYTMGKRIGIEPIAKAARIAGFGVSTHLGIRGEKRGLVPDEAFHDRVERSTGGYQKGMAINTSIGQGALLVTPLQLAVAYSAIANGGTVYRPTLVDHIETADFRVVRRFLAEEQGGDAADRDPHARPSILEAVTGRAPSLLERFEPHVVGQLAADEATLDAIRAGLIAVAQEPGGTAYWRRSRKVSMAGKTGTSQVVRLAKERLKASETPFEERDHAWFAAYAPIEDPRIVVAVINEHSGHGGSKAGPIAVRVIDAWFDLEQERAARATTNIVSEEGP